MYFARYIMSLTEKCSKNFLLNRDLKYVIRCRTVVLQEWKRKYRGKYNWRHYCGFFKKFQNFHRISQYGNGKFRIFKKKWNFGNFTSFEEWSASETRIPGKIWPPISYISCSPWCVHTTHFAFLGGFIWEVIEDMETPLFYAWLGPWWTSLQNRILLALCSTRYVTYSRNNWQVTIICTAQDREILPPSTFCCIRGTA